MYGHSLENEKEQVMATCPMCFEEGFLLGVLGWLRWFRCRQCGMDFSKTIKKKLPVPKGL